MHTRVLIARNNKDARLSFQSGVSLHGHTWHSKESLGFLGNFLQGHTCLRTWIERQKDRGERATGIRLDFDRAYWTPPLGERLAYALERRQIEELGLRPMVSLSDHNTIEAATLLRQIPEFLDTPVSVEWTVPFGQAVFHIGVHNLPGDRAQEWMARLRETTETADESKVIDLLAELDRTPSVLLVFNHPVWNFNGIAPDRFDFELRRFLSSANHYLHAFELNGLRSHRENGKAVRLAAEWNQPIVSGGDRHTCEPNAAINLTNAGDFSEFVDEIRNGQQSAVLLMPHYAEPLSWRFYQNFTHVVGEYPEHPQGRRRWDERTYHANLLGEMVPIADLWKGEAPGFLKAIFATAILAAKLPLAGLSRNWTSGEIDSLQLPLRNSPKWVLADDDEPLGFPRLGEVQLGRRK